MHWLAASLYGKLRSYVFVLEPGRAVQPSFPDWCSTGLGQAFGARQLLLNAGHA